MCVRMWKRETEIELSLGICKYFYCTAYCHLHEIQFSVVVWVRQGKQPLPKCMQALKKERKINNIVDTQPSLRGQKRAQHQRMPRFCIWVLIKTMTKWQGGSIGRASGSGIQRTKIQIPSGALEKFVSFSESKMCWIALCAHPRCVYTHTRMIMHAR